ncbi:PREDICTED: serine/threonine-protein kinase mTOR-like, partial [Rhagoletis zephyria]|uniref:serine/threonine-protein kinase mTOR-like n=1 Tax=Rhagoletis zephyria TaxID=28612 RepID=UPI0008117EA1
GGEFGNYAPHLIPHILKVLNQDSGSREVLMKLFGALQSFGSNLEDYVSLLVPPICAQFETSTRKDVEVRIAALRTIEVLCDDLELKDHSTRIVHAIVRTIDNNPHDKRLVNAAMDTLIKYTFQLGMHYRIYIPIVDSVLAKHRLSFVYYEQVVQNIKSGQFTEEQDVNNLTSGVAAENSRRRFNARRARELVHQNQQQSPSGDIAKNRTANNTLDDIRLGWVDYPRRISTEDWLEWLRKFNLDLINNSPAFSLRACYHIAQTCNTVARDLFNPAFLTHWNDLNTEKQKDFIESFQDVLKQQEIPEVTGILLNLAEFLEHIDVQNGNPLFDAEVLGERALKCRAYAKALHYKEKEFSLKKESGTPVGPDVLGSLITINNKLQQAQAAYGVLTYAMRSYEAGQLQLKERWFEKLNNFESAFFAHRLKFDQNNNDMEAVLGQMRCLEVLSEWDRLYGLVNDYYSHAEADRERMARMAVTATWNLNKWGEMESYVKQLPADSSDSAFFQAVIKVREEDYGQAQHFIDTARLLVDNELTTMAGESYSRAYPAMLSVQLMSELEEVMQYRLVPERREMIKQKWWHRLQGLQSSVDDWKKVLQVRSLVLSPREDMRSWLKFAKLCDRQQRYNLSFKTIVSLMGVKPNKLFRVGEPLPLTFPEVTLKFINHLWMAGHIFRAYRELDRFLGALESPNYLQGATFAYYTSSVSPVTPTGTEGHYSGLMVDPQQQQQQFASVATSFAVSGDVSPYSNATTAIGGGGGGSRVSPATSLNFATNAAVAAATAASTTKVPVVVQKLLSRAYLKMAKEQEFLVGFSSRSIPTILENLQKATERDKHYYKAWHAWAFYNFRALKYCKDRKPELRTNLELPAVRGFFRSVTLSPQQQSMQDTLRILTLWFDDGYNADVRAALEEGIKNVSIETWLQVIPQLIARIDAPHQSVAKLIHTLLTDIGKYHPQALIYPLTVANKSAVSSRSTAANSILHLMKVHSPNLVKQAILVSEELIRIAILWHELWHEGLEEASRLYFGDKNIDGMFETLEPLHKLLESTPLTLKEHTFCQNYGADLSKAHSYCRKYKLDPKKDPRNLNQAWDIYYHVFRRISRQLPQLTSLELQFVSPKLTECTDLELAVPGSYNPRQELICIAKVEPQLNIITSKQRPRKLTIKGSNGRNYMFLLKGHEDLRQDERVMQLFGLVNTLLNKEHNTSKQNLAIQRYAVIPLSPNSGLIGWVPHCDTLHSLIRDYREKRKILLNMEHRLMLRVGPDYDRLNLMQKVEVFEHALECTPGDDLAKILWLKSPNSEVWFDRRTNYTRSLAVMSMVGYILGLGDRHPSNLMLDRMSGKILHIDFGDCFEVAMNREKYPEKIPFRLTRMLINAMEITGLDGTFTTTCRNVMNVMRKHKESLMALLEAFLYDPLLNWRLIEVELQRLPLPNSNSSNTSSR